MHFPWSDAKVTFHIYSIFGDNLNMDVSNESPIMPDQEGIFEDGDELGGIYDENLDYEVVKCVKYRQDGDLVLEAAYGGFSIQEIDEDTTMCKAGFKRPVQNDHSTEWSDQISDPRKAKFTCEKETVPFLNYQIDFVSSTYEKISTKYGALEDIFSREIYTSKFLKPFSADWLYSQEANSGIFQRDDCNKTFQGGR